MADKKQNGWSIMLGLIGMVKPLLGMMILAIIMGCIGNLMATFITILGGYGLGIVMGMKSSISFSVVVIGIILCALLRGVLRYAEQASNHYIAFKLLARIRHKVFRALRRLAPAKLDGSEKGNLISILTTDIELLEVFYAHTISPIAIAIVTSIIMSCFIGSIHWMLGLIALIFYILVGYVIPVLNSKLGQQEGHQYRSVYGDLNTTVLDNLYGLEEILQFNQQEKRLLHMSEYTSHLEAVNQKLKKKEGIQRMITDTAILAAGILMAVAGSQLVMSGKIVPIHAMIAVIAMMSSFGPTAALSALSNNLNQTLASGMRVLNLLKEEPVVEEIENGAKVASGDIIVDRIDFSYQESMEQKNTVEQKDTLKQFSAVFEENTIHGILGKSGCGKSTLLKLLMRFYETDKGNILYQDTNVNEINTASLRKHISYVTQETFLFHDTIENNIKVANEHADREMVIEAAKKASIHDFIMSLPNGYETMVSELGDSLSGGERQRIGIARAFLHDSQVIFLDEPTSNIDSLNEAIILRSLDSEKKDKTILLVSHRKSTMGIADDILSM